MPSSGPSPAYASHCSALSKHQVKEEEELFPELEDPKMDMVAVGKQLAARKTELVAQSGVMAEAR
jgi:hypothetical protein